MDRHFLKSYVDLLIQTCHKRGAHAMGGMAAQIPIKNDPAGNDAALEKVRQDRAPRSPRRTRRYVGRASRRWFPSRPKSSEASTDPISSACLAPGSEGHRGRILLKVPEGASPNAGSIGTSMSRCNNLEAWLGGLGCVPIYNLMEDAANG